LCQPICDQGVEPNSTYSLYGLDRNIAIFEDCDLLLKGDGHRVAANWHENGMATGLRNA